MSIFGHHDNYFGFCFLFSGVYPSYRVAGDLFKRGEKDVKI